MIGLWDTVNGKCGRNFLLLLFLSATGKEFFFSFVQFTWVLIPPQHRVFCSPGGHKEESMSSRTQTEVTQQLGWLDCCELCGVLRGADVVGLFALAEAVQRK